MDISDSEIIVKQETEKKVWEVFGQFWRLPVEVQFIDQNDVASVRFCDGFPMLECQKDVLRTTFASDRWDGHCWWVLRSKLESIGHPTDRENPESIVVWAPPAKKVTLSKERDPDTDAMLAKLVEAGYFKSIEQADALFRVFRKAMLDQLLNQKKPIDLGFAKLWPVPYRPNWKEVLRNQEPTENRFEDPSLLMMFKKILPYKDRVQDTRKYVHVIGWTIEVEYSSVWWKMSHAVETQVFKLMRFKKGNKYGLVVLETMRTFKATGERLYRQFLEACGRPIANFCVVRATGNPIAVWSAPKPEEPSDSDWADNLEAELLGEAPVDRHYTAVVPRPWHSVCEALEVPGESGDVPALPVVESDRGNLRDEGGDLVESTDKP